MGRTVQGNQCRLLFESGSPPETVRGPRFGRAQIQCSSCSFIPTDRLPQLEHCFLPSFILAETQVNVPAEYNKLRTMQCYNVRGR